MSLLKLLSTNISTRRDNTIDVIEASKYNWTPLQLLCFTADHKTFLKYAKNNRITITDLTQTDMNGNTALHLLARAFNDEKEATSMMEDLITIMLNLIKNNKTKKVDDTLLLTNESGHTVISEAKYYSSHAIVKLLENALMKPKSEIIRAV
jgi:ankyrin repeat protein